MDRFDGKRAAMIWFFYICNCKTQRLIFQSLTVIEQIGKTAGSISAMIEGGGVPEILGQALPNVTNLQIKSPLSYNYVVFEITLNRPNLCDNLLEFQQIFKSSALRADVAHDLPDIVKA